MIKRHENLWLQGKELDKRVVQYWANPPEPFQEALAIDLQTRGGSSSGIANLLFVPSRHGDRSLMGGRD